MFWLTIATKSVSTVDAIEGMREDLTKFKADPPTQDELKFAKDAILNSFIFRLDTPTKVLHERMTYEFHGYPLDFLEKFRAGYRKGHRRRREPRGSDLRSSRSICSAGGGQYKPIRKAACGAWASGKNRYLHSSTRCCGPVMRRHA